MGHAGPPGSAPDPDRARSRAAEIVRTLQSAGHRALFAGGCVRDELLGLHPTDYDVATDATPQRLSELFRSTAHVGAHFGVVIVRAGPGPGVEVATFRKDGPYTDHRRPDSVEFATEAEDARRRDFTINALFLDPLAAADAPTIHGHIVDHVGGLADLRAGLVRAVGLPEDRLREDHLRALRAVRFAARLGYDIEPETARAIREHAGHLSGVSVERIGQELRRMLAHPTRARAAELIADLAMEAPIFGKALPHPRPRLSGLAPAATFEEALAAWILDREGEAARVAPYRKALCLSNDESRLIGDILDVHTRLLRDWPAMGVAPRKRLATRGGFAGALALLGSLDPAAATQIRAQIADLAATHGGLAPEPLLTGDDLVSLGHTPGPAFAVVLREVYDAQLEGRIADPAQARALAEKILASREPGTGSGV